MYGNPKKFTRTAYTYRPDGLRATKQQIGSDATLHVWDMGDIAADISTGETTAYLRGIGLVRRLSETERMTETGISTSTKTTYYQKNARGDVVQYLNSTGSSTDTYSYTAFGEERVNSKKDGNTENSFRYCGEYFDFETGSVYLRARYYSPGIGRFTQEDPARDGANYYVYCYNSPLMFVDPGGMKPYTKEYGDGQYTIITTTPGLDLTRAIAGFTPAGLGYDLFVKHVLGWHPIEYSMNDIKLGIIDLLGVSSWINSKNLGKLAPAISALGVGASLLAAFDTLADLFGTNQTQFEFAISMAFDKSVFASDTRQQAEDKFLWLVEQLAYDVAVGDIIFGKAEDVLNLRPGQNTVRLYDPLTEKYVTYSRGIHYFFHNGQDSVDAKGRFNRYVDNILEF